MFALLIEDVLRSMSLDLTLSCIILGIETGLQTHPVHQFLVLPNPVQSNKTKSLFIAKFHTD